MKISRDLLTLPLSEELIVIGWTERHRDRKPSILKRRNVLLGRISIARSNRNDLAISSVCIHRGPEVLRHSRRSLPVGDSEVTLHPREEGVLATVRDSAPHVKSMGRRSSCAKPRLRIYGINYRRPRVFPGLFCRRREARLNDVYSLVNQEAFSRFDRNDLDHAEDD